LAEEPFRAAHMGNLTTFVVNEWRATAEASEGGDASVQAVATAEGGDVGAPQVEVPSEEGEVGPCQVTN
jgi:hypothetical protein